MLCVLSVWFYRSLRFNYIMKEDDWLGETLEKRLELRTNEDCHDHHHLHFAVSITLCQLSQSWAYLHPSCMIAWSSVDEDPPPPSRSMFALGVRWSVADPWLTKASECLPSVLRAQTSNSQTWWWWWWWRWEYNILLMFVNSKRCILTMNHLKDGVPHETEREHKCKHQAQFDNTVYTCKVVAWLNHFCAYLP